MTGIQTSPGENVTAPAMQAPRISRRAAIASVVSTAVVGASSAVQAQSAIEQMSIEEQIDFLVAQLKRLLAADPTIENVIVQQDAGYLALMVHAFRKIG